MDMKQQVGQRIEQTRRQQGLTASELALKLDVSRQVLSGWENGKRSPSLEYLAKLATTLNVCSSYLLGLHDNHAPCGAGAIQANADKKFFLLMMG